jgi:transcriptional regulator with XRE-family HTH domain
MSQSFAGKNLKYLRKLRGLTQEEFAMKLNIKRSLLGAY